MPTSGSGGGREQEPQAPPPLPHYDPHTHAREHQAPQSYPAPPMNPKTEVGSAVGGPGARLDVPTGRPPGWNASPGSFITPVATAGWHAPGFPPPPAGSVAQSAWSLQAPLPIGEKATHFSGPIVSGGIPQVPAWTAPHGGPMLTDPIGGSAMLTAGLWVDFSQGNFTVPIQFPPDSLILSIGALTAVQFTTPPTFQIGTTSGGSQIKASGPLPAPGGPLTFTAAFGQLPLWDAQTLTPPLTPFQAFLTVAGNTGTAGLGVILVQFIRIAQRWT